MNTQVHPFQEFIQTPGDQKKKKKKIQDNVPEFILIKF